MNKTTVHMLAIGVALLVSLGCGAPRTEPANESAQTPEAAETGQTENKVFEEDFEAGNAGEWTDSTPSETEDDEGTRADSEIE